MSIRIRLLAGFLLVTFVLFSVSLYLQVALGTVTGRIDEIFAKPIAAMIAVRAAELHIAEARHD